MTKDKLKEFNELHWKAKERLEELELAIPDDFPDGIRAIVLLEDDIAKIKRLLIDEL